MENNSSEMNVLEHLDELRKRLLYSLISLVICVIIAIIFADYLIDIVAKPVGGFEKLLSIQITENISVFFRISLLAGFIMAFPFFLLQIFLFINPGLKKKERRWLIRVIPIATILFVAGVIFAYFVMLPVAVPFLIEFPGPEVLPKWKDYVNFVTGMIFWIAVSFETPLFMFVLAKLGIVSAKGLIKQWRLALVLIAIIAAVVTPTPDPINMFILMVPLIVLYILSIILAVFAGKQKQAEGDEYVS